MHENPYTHEDIGGVWKLKFFVADDEQEDSKHHGDVLCPSYCSIVGIDSTDDEENKVDDEEVVRKTDGHGGKKN